MDFGTYVAQSRRPLLRYAVVLTNDPAAFPAALGNVISAGGTTLTRATTARGWAEQAWAGAGSGCSAYIAKPAWQKDKHCSMRTVADVSAVADPNTGLAFYDTFGFVDNGGWLVGGGTRLASPLTGAMIARSGRQRLPLHGQEGLRRPDRRRQPGRLSAL